MLTSTNIQKINDLIGKELRKVDSILSSEEEKMEAIERIVKLKELLTPQPSRQDILRELATAFQETRHPSPPANTLSDLLGLLNRR